LARQLNHFAGILADNFPPLSVENPICVDNRPAQDSWVIRDRRAGSGSHAIGRKDHYAMGHLLSSIALAALLFVSIAMVAGIIIENHWHDGQPGRQRLLGAI
jgi:hypothetical protein